MSTSLDWSRFDASGVGHEKAFEAFTAQLFERWLHREYKTTRSFYVLHGAGGDGGVEAFGRFSTEGTIGFQAKWFPENIGSSQISQIQGSIDTARKTFPDLKRYVIAIPKNLTKGLPGKKDSVRKGGVERWDELMEYVASAYPDLEILRWDENGILNQLAAQGNAELRGLWFSGELTHEKLSIAWEKAKSRLGQRYIPSLHAVGEVEDLLARDLWTPIWMANARSTITTSKEQLLAAVVQLHDFEQTLGPDDAVLLRGTLEKVATAVSLYVEYASALDESLGSGPSSVIGIAQPSAEADTSIEEFAAQLDDFHERDSLKADIGKRSLASASNAAARLRALSRMIRESAHPRVIAGPSGCGKTHAVAHYVEGYVANGYPGLLTLAKEDNPALGIGALLSKALDLPGWPLARILDGLEALALVKQVASEGAEFARALLVIDGLEESPEWAKWKDALNDLKTETARRPRLHVVATARPESVQALSLEEPEFSRLELAEDGGVDVPQLLQTYSKHYRIDVREVPWLGWALRTPLEVRLLADEFADRSISVEEGATANLLTLFRSKLKRIEADARMRAGTLAWTAGLNLVATMLTELSDLSFETERTAIADTAIIDRVATRDAEFTAQRIRIALDVAIEHGLVERFLSPSIGIGQPRPEYGMATRHISDFIIARQSADKVTALLADGGSLTYPSILLHRPDAATLFAAQLAESGKFLTDVNWDISMEELLPVHAGALALIAPQLAATRRDEVAEHLRVATASNRTFLERVVVPVARIPHHPLGPALVDECLRSLPLIERDPIWSVPDDLSSPGPWKGNGSTILDDIELDSAIDEWNGLPLLIVWICSSVVESRRRHARESLASWGSRRLDQMALLVEHAAHIDDPQVVDDVLVAALGAAMGSSPRDSSVNALARLMDTLFFATDAPCWTPSVIARTAARGIVERAAMLFPDESGEFLERCRPPYSPRGPEWPPIDVTEMKASGHFGGEIVNHDLAWYVAEDCFKEFASRLENSRPADVNLGIDASLLDAIDQGSLEAPARLVQEVRQRKDDREEEAAGRKCASKTFLLRLRKLYGKSHPRKKGRAKVSDEVILRWASRRFFSHRNEKALEDDKYSDEFRALLRHAQGLTGTGDIAPNQIRNGLIAQMVRDWGWTKEKFAFDQFDAPALTIDHAISRAHRQSASHGSRNPVCTFREKYVWAAIERVAGELADRLPVLSEESRTWTRVASMDVLGNGLPDPLPYTLSTDSVEVEFGELWEPSGVLPICFSEEVELARRAERWLSEGTWPEPLDLVHGHAEGWEEMAVLGLSHFRRAHQSCIDQRINVRAFALSPSDLAYLRRDAPHIRRTWWEDSSWVSGQTYISAALACWAPWLNWVGTDQGYNTFDATGDATHVRMIPLVGQFTTRFEGAELEEPTAWILCPYLGRKIGVIGMRGNRHNREFFDRNEKRVAVELDYPSEETYSFDHHYLAMERDVLRSLLETDKLTPVWIVRIAREVTPALFMNNHRFDIPSLLIHRSRSATWLVIGNESILLDDEFDDWK